MTMLFSLAVVFILAVLAAGAAPPVGAPAWFGTGLRSGPARHARGFGLAALLAVLAACEAEVEPASFAALPLPASTQADLSVSLPATPATETQTQTLYAHSELNVRKEPSRTAIILRTLRRGDAVTVAAEENGWSAVMENGERTGYVSRRLGVLRASAPVVAVAPQPAYSGSSGSGYHTGPRGGCYTYSASGRKRYVDRSYCH